MQDQNTCSIPNPNSDSERLKEDLTMAVTTQPDPHSLRTSSYEPSLEKEPRNIDDDTQSGQPVLSGNLSDRKGDDVMNKDEDGRLSRATTEEEVYITGFKLMMVVISVTSAAFLMLLDVSIVATVSYNKLT